MLTSQSPNIIELITSTPESVNSVGPQQAAFDSVWPRLRVLARCSPTDKLTIVRGANNPLSPVLYLYRVPFLSSPRCSSFDPVLEP